MFIDVDNIPAGADWETHLQNNVEKCDVLLALIGPNWASVLDESGKRRLDQDKDFVRSEIKSALNRDIIVVPVLHGKAELPKETELPDDLKRLLKRHASTLNPRTFDEDVTRLFAEIGLKKRNRTRWFIPALISAAGLIAASVFWLSGALRPPETAAEAPNLPSPQQTNRAANRSEPIRSPLSTFNDGCPHCPNMVVLPSNRFTIGSEEGTLGAHPDELPTKTLAMKSFAMAENEVTFDLWTECVMEGTCPAAEPDAKAPGHAGYPVMFISWNAVTQHFVPWLNAKTGRTNESGKNQYRLPSEAEWEYAAREGGKLGPYYWNGPESDACTYGNLYDVRGSAHVKSTRAAIACDDGFEATAPVDNKFPANSWGLRNMFGNISEWAQDCYVEGYGHIPMDGSAYEFDGCEDRVVRGGSWLGTAHWVRVQRRDHDKPLAPERGMGFRLAMSLPQPS